MCVCCGYCREEYVRAVVTVGKSDFCYCRDQWLCALSTAQGRVTVCCGYSREQCVCAVGTVGIVCVYCGYCREE